MFYGAVQCDVLSDPLWILSMSTVDCTVYSAISTQVQIQLVVLVHINADIIL